jgi:hypothetical protein
MSGPGGGSTLRAPMATWAELIPQSQITQQPINDNGDNGNKEGGEEEEEEEEMGASDEGAADAMTTTTFNPAAGCIVCSTRTGGNNNIWSVGSQMRGLRRCCNCWVLSRTMLIC